jgi:hypothetical protein
MDWLQQRIKRWRGWAWKHRIQSDVDFIDHVLPQAPPETQKALLFYAETKILDQAYRVNEGKRKGAVRSGEVRAAGAGRFWDNYRAMFAERMKQPGMAVDAAREQVGSVIEQARLWPAPHAPKARGTRPDSRTLQRELPWPPRQNARAKGAASKT